MTGVTEAGAAWQVHRRTVRLHAPCRLTSRPRRAHLLFEMLHGETISSGRESEDVKRIRFCEHLIGHIDGWAMAVARMPPLVSVLSPVGGAVSRVGQPGITSNAANR
jgi:hypothetical protein